MNDEIIMKEILSLFTFLTRYVEIHTKSSFNDISFSLEKFCFQKHHNTFKFSNTICRNLYLKLESIFFALKMIL